MTRGARFNCCRFRLCTRSRDSGRLPRYTAGSAICIERTLQRATQPSRSTQPYHAQLASTSLTAISIHLYAELTDSSGAQYNASPISNYCIATLLHATARSSSSLPTPYSPQPHSQSH